MRLDELRALLEHATPIRRDRFRAKCPAHDGKSTESLSVTIGDAGSVLLKCFAGCTAGEIVEALGLTLRDLFQDVPTRVEPARTARPRPAASTDADDFKRRRAAELWQASRPIGTNTAGEYLRGRNCTIPAADADLRYHPHVDLFGFAGPALLGRISAARDARRALGLHITWLRRGGADWQRGERRYLGAKAGGVVRLSPDDAVSTSLAIAEGVETALSLARWHAPVWACLDASNLAEFPVLDGIAVLVIGADRDASGTGQAAAVACADRWLDAGREVRVLLPDRIGTDFNDEARIASR